MADERFYTTAELSTLLGISRVAVFKKIKSGKIKAQKMGRNFVIFKKELGDIEFFIHDLTRDAKQWSVSPTRISDDFYCQNSGIFQARLITMEMLMSKDQNTKKLFSLLTSIAGEIGNNSFDHNIGQWPDIPGIFFGYDLDKKKIVLADRGLGVLETLKRVKPGLKNHEEALRVAFTEMISGRSPEARGNGLKYVRKIISKYPIDLLFQTGDKKLILKRNTAEIRIQNAVEDIRGCIALITYS